MNILIVNLHSAKNLGDEAINRSTLLLIREKYPNSNITFIANDPISWGHFKDIDVIPSFSYFLTNYNTYKFDYLKTTWFIIMFLIFFIKKLMHLEKLGVANQNYNKIIEKISEADLILSCGGGNYYTNSIVGFSFLINSFYIVLGKVFDKRIIFLPQSFGPFRSKFHRSILTLILNFAEVVYVRDIISYELILNSKIMQGKIKKTMDMVFFLDQEIKLNVRENKELSIGITLLDRKTQLKSFVNQSQYYLSIIKIINHLVTKFDAEIYLIVQCVGPSRDQNDSFITQRLYNDVKNMSPKIRIVQKFETSLNLLAFIKKLDVTIASRMHTAIFSLIKNVPCLLIGYQPKSFGLYKQLGLEEFYLDINHMNPDETQKRLNKLIDEKSNLQQFVVKDVFPSICVLRKELIDSL